LTWDACGDADRAEIPLLGVLIIMAFDKSSLPDQDADLDDVLQPGTGLSNNQYRIESYLRAGGFGITYLARNSFNRDVVVKECFVPSFCTRSHTAVRPRSEASKAQMQKAIRAFLNEAQTLSQLQHPNIVRIRHSFQENDTAYMALEYIRGHDLLDMIEDKVTLTPHQIVLLTQKLVSAVAHVHDRNVLHCDISPDNICIRADGEPVLIDFGSARKMMDGIGERTSGFSMVKDGYSPPELYEANATVTPGSDIYALGASLYHAITGHAPLDCQSRLAAVSEGRPDPVPSLAATVTGYPRGFLAAIDKALSLRPADRHASAQDWQRAFAEPPVETAARNVALLRRVVVKPQAAAVTPAPKPAPAPLRADGTPRVQFRYPPAQARVQTA
jgi:serine/threonine protein kinase